MRTMCTVVVATLGLGTWVGTAYGQAVSPTVDVSYSTTAASVVDVGSTFNISVLAQVENPTGDDDGVFVFSQNFMEENLGLSAPTPLEIKSVTETGSTDLPGSDGTPVTDGSGNTIGEQGIYGGYDAQTVGVGAPATIFTVEVEAIAPGEATFTDGPSSAEYFTNETADGFQLYDGTDPQTDYPAGPTISVVPVPEPASVGLLGLIISMVSFRWRGRGSSREGCLDMDGMKASDGI